MIIWALSSSVNPSNHQSVKKLNGCTLSFKWANMLLSFLFFPSFFWYVKPQRDICYWSVSSPHFQWFYILCVFAANPTTGCWSISWGIFFWLPPSHETKQLSSFYKQLANCKPPQGTTKTGRCCVRLKNWRLLDDTGAILVMLHLQGTKKLKWSHEILEWYTTL